MVDIIHRVGMQAPASKVYAALATVEGVAAWWTEETNGTSKVGETFNTRFKNPAGEEVGNMTFKVTALQPDRQVRWHVTDGPPEWIGTDVNFDLHREGDFTIVRFGHRHWREEIEFMSHCSMKWAVFMLSLKEFVETGKGRPAPADLKIDNWM